MTLDWRVVPIERWPGEQTAERKRHNFRRTDRSSSYYARSSVPFSETTDLLARELRQLGAKNVLLQMAVTDRDIRNDGWIRANARPSHPGVILTFDSDHGPLSYPCDTFDDWQANVRAIALALEALRKVDRYGVTRSGEQYRGFRALPPAGGSTTTMTAAQAARVVVEAAGFDPVEARFDPQELTRSAVAFRSLYRDAAKLAHPDAPGGSHEAFTLLQEAKRVLERHHGIGGGS